MKFQLFYWIYFVLIISSINVFAHDEEPPKYIRAKRGVIADSIKNGLINCALNKAMGGSCRQGFKAGIIATGASAATNKVVGSGGGGFIQDTLRGAIVSGITSKAMGGSATEGAKTGAVANGAMGALSRLLNRNS
uniref:Uncharacterized protein n=1 Tax=Panagrolaimus sp. PS1159 TaxID=55785 RepID=A0AC35FHX4_9BILA